MANDRDMFESRISAAAKEKPPTRASGKLDAETASSWSYGMGRSREEMCGKILRICKSYDSTIIQSQHHAWMIIQFLKKKSAGELSTFWSQIVVKCLYLDRIERPDILWSVNKLARAVTKWTKSCDKRLARLISYIHHTSEYWQYCCVGNTAQQCRPGLFQDSDFIPYRTEQMDPRESLGNPSAVVKPNMDNSIPIKHTNVIPTNIDHIPSNTTHSGSGAMLYIFQ